MRKNPIAKMYGRFHGLWYDPFQKIWGSRWEAETIFISKLRSLSTKETRILDLGCGTGANFERLKKNNISFREYRGVDITPEMLAIARKKWLGINVGIEDVDTVREDYDLTISNWFFEHLTTEQRKNILKRKGKHLHMYLGGRKRYNLFLRIFSSLFHFSYVDDKEFRGKKTHWGIATTILEI